MLSDLLIFAAATLSAGNGGTTPHSHPTVVARPAPNRTDTTELPASARTALRAARAVLSGVGIESGSASARAQNAVAVLRTRVRRQSDPNALRLAFQAYYNFKAAHPEQVRKPYLYFVDYGLDSTTPRGYVFDMEALSIVDGPFTVAHGRGSAPGRSRVPLRFSNREGSNATSLGLFLAQETYSFTGHNAGRLYRSVGLRLSGLSGAFNSAARRRGVVVHGAPYVTRLAAGRSEGCPALEQWRAQSLLPRIANGGLVFLFSPLDRTWLTRDPWAHGRSAFGGNG